MYMARVFNAWRNKGNQATVSHSDIPLVDHCCPTATGQVKLHPARHEIGVADIRSAGHQPCHINLGSRPKQNAAAVDQKHLAVGFQAAKDYRRIPADHAVQHDRGGRWLDKARGLVSRNGKPLPFDNGF